MMRPMLATFFWLAALVAETWVLDAQLPSRLTEKNLARGKSLYATQCERCHGPHGDDTGYSYITPLSGLKLRLGDVRMRQFRGPSFTLRGRFFPEDEARDLMAYVLTLPGEKGYRRPEAVMSPYLLGQKLWNRHYLVIDVRTPAEYKKSHIRAAINLPPSLLGSFARPVVSHELETRILVLYDDARGLRAARVWRTIAASGHNRVTVLDGGFDKWVSENREVSTEPRASVTTPLLVEAPGATGPPASARPSGITAELRFDPTKTVLEDGFLSAPALTDYLHSAGFKGAGRYRLKGQPDAADLLAFQLHLLGFSARPAGIDEIIVE